MTRWHGWVSWKSFAIVLGITAASGFLVLISVPTFQKNISESDVAKARQDLDTLRQAISMSEAQGDRVQDLPSLSGGRYLQEVPLDPTGRPYRYDPSRRVLIGHARGEVIEVALGNPASLGSLIPSDFHHSVTAEAVPEGFLDPALRPESTFAIDVDTASWGRTRAAWKQGRRPRAGEVRIEELVNAFSYELPAPRPGDVIGITAETSRCPWNEDNLLLRIALRGKPPGQRGPANLVFLCDVSGSMESPEKLPLLKRSLRMLLDQLRSEDRVSLVTYAGSTGIALPPTPASERARIAARIDDLGAAGGTDGAGGIELAYRAAQEGFLKGGVNRVILATDGDFNLGISDPAGLEELIAAKARTGVYLTVLGVGDSLEGDRIMETLADRGNGAYYHLGDLEDARRALVSQVDGTLVTVARDVKVQVSFDPAAVAGYRQVGYENRQLASHEFADDAKDGGEIGAGQAVTALYEVMPARKASASLGKIAVRHQDPDVTSLTPGAPPSRLVERDLPGCGPGAAAASSGHRLASALAWLGQLLRTAGELDAAAMRRVRALIPGGSPERDELIQLVSGLLAGSTSP